MRRVSSYGGPSGVAGSERLKQKLSLTPGLHLISTSSSKETGFFAVVEDLKDERVIHRTFGATRNFYAIASNLKQVSRRKPWVARKDPFIFDEPVDSSKDYSAPTLFVEETNGKHSVRPVVNDEVPPEASSLQAVLEIPSNHRQVVEDVPAGADTRPLGLSDNPAVHPLANGVQGAGPDCETNPPSIVLAEADNLLSSSATAARQGAEISRVRQIEEDTSHNVDVLSNENSLLQESDGGLQESQNGRSKDMAAVAIQRSWRGWQQRKDFKEVKDRVVFLQSLVRRNQEFKQYHRTLKAAVVVQKHWRGQRGRSLVKYLNLKRIARVRQQRIEDAAVVMQKHWRAQRGRCFVKHLKMELELAVQEKQRRNHAAIVLQKHWRAQRGRRYVKHLKMEHAVKEKQIRDLAVIVLQKHWRAQQAGCLTRHLRMEQVAREKKRTNDAATVLQKHWRAHQSRQLAEHFRKELALKQKEKIVNAAVVLQKNWRAHQGMCLGKHLKKERVRRELRRIDDASVVLQKHWRARQGRRVVKQLRKEQVLREQQRMDDAAVVLQKRWRAQQGRRLVKQLKMEQILRKQQRSYDASVVLQKHWRAQQGRRLVKQLKMDQVLREQQRTNDASVLLQKHWRAQQGRRLVKQLKMDQVLREQQRTNDASVVLQKHWRAQQGRRLGKQLKREHILREQERVNNASTVLQKCWRAQQGRRLFKRLKIEYVVREQQRIDNAAVVVQKYWRAKQGRSLMKRLKLEQVLRDQQRNCDAAIVIQKHWRARQARCSVKLLKMEQIAIENQKTDNAAAVLQKHWRGLRCRSLVKRLKMELSLKVFQRSRLAAIVLQKQWRGRLSRLLVERMRMEQLLRQRKMDQAATVLQKHWRGWQSRCLVKDLKDKRIVDNAAIVVQKHWRAHQSRVTVKHLNMELAAREKSQRVTAAITLQKHWRARQSVLVVKHLKMENTRREQHRAENAATTLQKHWRGQYSRRLVKSLQRENALRKLQRMDNAAITVQKHWRQFQSRHVVKLLYMERADRERAAVCIQARLRGNATRVKFKAALAIQKSWQLYLSSRLALAIHQACQERRQQAVIVLQAYARGFVVRRRLRNVAKAISKAGDSAESSKISSLVERVDSGSQFVDQIYNKSAEGWQKSECAPINSQDLCGGHDFDGELSTTSVGDAQSQCKQVQEDWNYVAVDQLEECLDTCLGSLRPLPAGSQHGLPGLDVPEKAKEFISTNPDVENKSDVRRAYIPTESSRSARNDPNNPTGSSLDTPRMQSCQVMPQATPIGAKEQGGISSALLQETELMDKPAQGRSIARQTLKQKEQRLKQFAQVFLLQRTIAVQQQRAQAAPPFPPPMPTARSDVPTHTATQADQPVEVANGDHKDVAVQNTTPSTTTQLIQINGGKPEEEHHVVCEIVDPENEQTATKQAPARHSSCGQQVIERPGEDVVLDMVLLLRRIKEEYGNSEGDYEGESSTWCTPGCGDIEEGIPLLERNLGLMKESSMSKLANAVSIKHISIPDVNAVLLVFIAMVVYTRTVCKGLFFGARQTQRRS